MRFRAVVELGGKTATGFAVPAEVVESLGSGKRPAVTVNGHTYRSTVAPMGGRYLIPLSAENRTAAGVNAGDEADVDVELDAAPRVVEVPEDFRNGLDRLLDHEDVPGACGCTRGARKAEATRQRRIARALEMLRA